MKLKFHSVSLLLMLTTVAVWLFQSRLAPFQATTFLENFGLVPERDVLNVFDLSWTSRLAVILSSLFLHPSALDAGLTLAGLLWLGSLVEDKWGPLGFLSFYLVSGALANLARAWAELSAPATSSVTIVGASGAIAAMGGAWWRLQPSWKRGAWVLTWLAIQVAVLQGERAFVGPVLGLILGIFCGRFFLPKARARLGDTNRH
ncbi:MAG: rhomboid family intramembrane serine protease [Bdellovibrionaceae bacterium]|nr:rhomboid family intramembrane serine protease [Pseudobdellovibrionaceae bacterium]